MFIYLAIAILAIGLMYLIYLNGADSEAVAINNDETVAFIVRDRFKILSAPELIAVLDLQPSINKIQMDLGLSNENWTKDALPFLHSYIEFVQRLPASESHHHAGDGGLVKHTLDVAQLALVAANSRSWPPGAKTEDIPKLTAVWKYGIMCAAILHDVGKTLTAFQIELFDTATTEAKIQWVADAGSMNLSGRSFYRVEFPTLKAAYKLHGEIAWTFFQGLVPVHVRQWMAVSDPNLIVALRSYLTGNRENNPFVNIITDADKVSTARDLRHGSRQRFSTSKLPPLIEVVMETLKTIMATERSAYFSTAITAGGDMFRVGETVYIMSKHVPDHVRSYLKKINSSAAPSFPTDNQRIFDTLLEYGAVIPPEGLAHKAITTISVQFVKDSGEVKDQHFKVLAFKTSTLFAANNVPAEFQGRLSVLSDIEQGFTAATKSSPQSTDAASSPQKSDLDADNLDSKQFSSSAHKQGTLNMALNNLSETAQTAAKKTEPITDTANHTIDTATNSIQSEPENAILLPPVAIFNSQSKAEPAIEPVVAEENPEVSLDNIASVEDVLGVLDSVFSTLSQSAQLSEEEPVLPRTSTTQSASEVLPTNTQKNDVITVEEKHSPNKEPIPATEKQSTKKKRATATDFNKLAAVMCDQPTNQAKNKRKTAPEPLATDAVKEHAVQLNQIDSAQAGIEHKLAHDKSQTTDSPRPVNVDDGSVSIAEMYMLDQQILEPERISDVPVLPITPDSVSTVEQTGEEAMRQNHKLLRDEGMRFLNWLTDGLSHGSLEINNSDAVVHFIEEGMLIVSPRVFALYTGVSMTRGNPDCPTTLAQKGFLQLGLHKRNNRGAIWQINERNKPKQRIFSAILIPESMLKNIIQPSSRPQNNTTLVIMNPLRLSGDSHE